MSFTSYFPSLVSSLVLLAPAGLIRENHFSTANKVMYSSGWVPESWLEWIVKRRLRGSANISTPVATRVVPEVEVAAREELPKKDELDRPLLSKIHPGIVVAHAVVSGPFKLPVASIEPHYRSLTMLFAARHGRLIIIKAS